MECPKCSTELTSNGFCGQCNSFVENIIKKEQVTTEIESTPPTDGFGIFMYFIGAIIIIASIISGIVLGNQFATHDQYGEAQFNIGLMFGVLIGGTIQGLMVIALGKILVKLSDK